ncbi:MAG: glutathione peroxidase [Bacteroidales bacterium]|nr:glutathione peroxidase [Bacteroidales bacterium]
MKRLIVLSIFITGGFMMNNLKAQSQTLHDFRVQAIDGSDFDFSTLKGKKVLIVNTASKCGLTPQYKELQELYGTYKDKNFTIVGFPANNFMNQEPGTDGEIKEFCEVNYGVTFLMMSKVSVKGDDMHPLYQWLTSKEKNGKMDSEVTWNFQKYMIDENGILIDFVPPKESPGSEKIRQWIEGE